MHYDLQQFPSFLYFNSLFYKKLFFFFFYFFFFLLFKIIILYFKIKKKKNLKKNKKSVFSSTILFFNSNLFLKGSLKKFKRKLIIELTFKKIFFKIKKLKII
jgi:hypothetical protein